ncbi:MAG: hypothetical protein KF708_16675 [Pirellulales bacterium]|nr:hypothetical protein [Pirellulales bacterium]
MLMTLVLLFVSTLGVCPEGAPERPDALCGARSDDGRGSLLLVIVVRSTKSIHDLFRPSLAAWVFSTLGGDTLAPQIGRSSAVVHVAAAPHTLQSQHIRCQV